jgi:hypothetical protein
MSSKEPSYSIRKKDSNAFKRPSTLVVDKMGFIIETEGSVA